MASFLKNLYAFFDPTKAINDEGYLVEADGFFDTGNGSRDYVTIDSLGPVGDFFYGPGSGSVSGIFDPATSSDVVSASPSDVINDFKELISNAALQQQDAAQSSADRAMEFSAEQAQINRDFNAEQAQLNRDFQAQMSNTSYQRAMADLQAAGINPKLVAQLGAASTPSGSAASGSAPSGQAASMSAANLSSLSQVLSTYITGADALDRQNNGFVQSILSALFWKFVL